MEPWTEAQRVEASGYWKQGFTIIEIGHLMGKSKGSIHGIANKHRHMFPQRADEAPRLSPEEKQAKRLARTIERDQKAAAKAEEAKRKRLAGRAAAAVANINRRAAVHREGLPGAPKLGGTLRAAFLPLEGSRPVSRTDPDRSGCCWPLALGDDVDPLLGKATHYCGLPVWEKKGPYCLDHTTKSAGLGTRSERDAHRTLVKADKLDRLPK